jgi:hypothetical protein
MTREEANAKMPLPRWYGEDGQKGWLLDNLEAIGLIKFEEKKNAFTEAKKYITDVIMYEYGKPEIKIAEMSEIIKGLVRIIEINNCNIDV